MLQHDPRYYEFQEGMIGLYIDAGARTNPPAYNQTSEVSGNLRGLTLPCHMPQAPASVFLVARFLLGCPQLLDHRPVWSAQALWRLNSASARSPSGCSGTGVAYPGSCPCAWREPLMALPPDPDDRILRATASVHLNGEQDPRTAYRRSKTPSLKGQSLSTL